ncbi:MAG: FprA family A-type flavoprotein [Candidatus Brocadiaceae bacterium]|nr:FprA family A-type flavoprotein [Candidatus Brocadiaceae bacterium]
MRRSKIAVIYHSQSLGNTKAAAEHVIEGIRSAGDFEVVSFNTNDGRVDPAILEECAGVAFGAPDYFSYPAGMLKQFMDDWLIAKRKGNEELEGIPVALFATHGGGGRIKEPFEGLFQRVGPLVAETLMIKGAPGEAEAEACRKLGAELARRAAQSPA